MFTNTAQERLIRVKMALGYIPVTHRATWTLVTRAPPSQASATPFYAGTGSCELSFRGRGIGPGHHVAVSLGSVKRKADVFKEIHFLGFFMKILRNHTHVTCVMQSSPQTADILHLILQK